MKDWFFKLPNGDLRPVQDGVLKRLAVGEAYEFEFKIPRNIKFHRKFFAFLASVYGIEEIQLSFSSIKHLRGALTIDAGHYETIVGMDGKEYKIPKSISFANMEEADFDQFYSRVMQVILDRLPEYVEGDIHALENEIMSYA